MPTIYMYLYSSPLAECTVISVTLLWSASSELSWSVSSMTLCNHSSTVAVSNGSRSPARISASRCSAKACIVLSSSSILSMAEADSGVFSARRAVSMPEREATSMPKS